MRTFGHTRPVRDDAGNVIEQIPSPVQAITRASLDGSFGVDRNRRLVVSLTDGDLITIRPAGTRRSYSARACDVLRFIIQGQARSRQLERARIAKERKAVRLAAERQRRAERKLRIPVEQ